MIEKPIHDLDDLMTAFGVESVSGLEWAIEEDADIDDGRAVFIDEQGPGVVLGMDTRGLEIEFPTNVQTVLKLAADVEQMIEDDAAPAGEK